MNQNPPIANKTLLAGYKSLRQRMAEQAAKRAAADRQAVETTRRILAANPIVWGAYA